LDGRFPLEWRTMAIAGWREFTRLLKNADRRDADAWHAWCYHEGHEEHEGNQGTPRLPRSFIFVTLKFGGRPIFAFRRD
jgi:hypothetical protein